MRVLNRLRPIVKAVRSTISPVGLTLVVLLTAAFAVYRVMGWQELRVVVAGSVLLLAIAALFAIGRSVMDGRLIVDPERVVVGEVATAGIEVRNPASRRAFPVRVEVPVGKGLARFDVPSLPGGEAFSAPFIIPTNRRAVVDIGPARAIHGDPLGIFRREVELSPQRQLFVHPRTVALEPLTAGFIRDLEGQTTNDRSTSDVAFYALREYVPGDARKHIHWKSTAKRVDGKLMVREFLDTRRSHLALVLATRRDEYLSGPEFELAVSIVGSLGARAFLDDQQVSSLSGLGPMPTFSRETLLDHLAGVDMAGSSSPLSTTAQQARNAAGGASVVVIVGGSGLRPNDLQLAASRFSLDVRVVGLRCVERGVSGIKASGARSLAEVATLDALPRVMWAVANG